MKIKQELRALFSERTAALPSVYRERADAAIAETVFKTEVYPRAAVVFVYAGVRNEIATRGIIGRALADGKRVLVPRVHDTGVMDAVEISRAQDLRPDRGVDNRYGLLEPNASIPAAAPSVIDLALVPCLSCDLYGNRLGYGGGYYDRYLKRVATDQRDADREPAHLVALCREHLLSMRLPTGPHDVPMHAFITESGLFPVISAT
jgi:5-formyltetrahydrofolate cyclo-ligase